MPMWGWHDGGSWWVMVVWMGVFWGLIVAGILLVMRMATRSAPPPPDQEESSGRRILDERFARGEIDEQEYRRRREILAH
ncbi:MAG TPA: SHOCT domain-containing protein [Actinomycetota bacterium]